TLACAESNKRNSDISILTIKIPRNSFDKIKRYNKKQNQKVEKKSLNIFTREINVEVLNILFQNLNYLTYLLEFNDMSLCIYRHVTLSLILDTHI
ncbi:hypothetical protein BpHYR1_036941, partial [Brachionus plicatilis]